MKITIKKFPQDYSNHYINIIESMAFNPKNIFVEGTFAIKGMLYPSDVDVFEKVNVKYKNIDECINYLTKSFQSIVKKLMSIDNIIVGYILAGSVDGKPLKWRAKDILNGYNKGFELKDAFLSPSLFKIDVIAYVDNLYIEFSNTFQFFNNKVLMNKYELFKPESLDDDIKKYKKEGNYFKMAKRIFIKTKNEKLMSLFNGEVGFLNQICSNIDTLINVIELRPQFPKKNISNEIDGFITRINLLANKKLLDNSHLNLMLKQCETETERDKLIKNLSILYDDLYNIVQSESKTELHKIKLV